MVDLPERRTACTAEWQPLTQKYHVLVPVPDAGTVQARLTLATPEGRLLARASFDLTPCRRWTVRLSPFSHVDVGFTNSQENILRANIENLRVALDLIDQTREYPAAAQFKFLTEVSWPLYEFLGDRNIREVEKARMRSAIRVGDIEVGGFLISHQNKFMPTEALFRSTDVALWIAGECGAAIRTGCLNDLADLSGVVKPLSAAGIPYFLAGPNTTHYVTPPLFYLRPPLGRERVLCWLTPNLNGYGENFDFKMRPDLPVTDSALAEIEARLGPYLHMLEIDGSPPGSVREHFDFDNATWPYPYDTYFLPFYPAHAVDNGPQDRTASELVQAWNARWAWPRLEICNPARFFHEMEARYREVIPTVRGELPAFWGEQIYFACAQVDPAKETGQREFERSVIQYEAARAHALLDGRSCPDISDEVARAYKLIALNNDHNPGPVPFGHTRYTKADVATWRRTRREWIEDIAQVSQDAVLAVPPIGDGGANPGAPPCPVKVTDTPGAVDVENAFYSLKLDKDTGAITYLYDKELRRELRSLDCPYGFNQYVAIARGENAGLRGNAFIRPGLSQVNVRLLDSGPERAIVRVIGTPTRVPDALQVLRTFVREKLRVRFSRLAVIGLTKLVRLKLGPLRSVVQDIELRRETKAVYFTQRVVVDRDQVLDHAFAYPFNVPQGTRLIVDGPRAPYRFGLAAPWGDGDLIPVARMTSTDFPGINDITQVFEWIHGAPADAVFRSYVLAFHPEVQIAFTSLDSGVVFPGMPAADPARGPFEGGFFHLAVGATGYGRAFLGAPRSGEYTFRSALTSFHAEDEYAARAHAATFARQFGATGIADDTWECSNPSIQVAAVRALSPDTLLLRLWETSGRGGTGAVRLPGTRAIASARRCRSDGGHPPDDVLDTTERTVTIELGPCEVASIAVALEAHESPAGVTV